MSPKLPAAASRDAAPHENVKAASKLPLPQVTPLQAAAAEHLEVRTCASEAASSSVSLSQLDERALSATPSAVGSADGEQLYALAAHAFSEESVAEYLAAARRVTPATRRGAPAPGPQMTPEDVRRLELLLLQQRALVRS